MTLVTRLVRPDLHARQRLLTAPYLVDAEPDRTLLYGVPVGQFPVTEQVRVWTFDMWDVEATGEDDDRHSDDYRTEESAVFKAQHYGGPARVVKRTYTMTAEEVVFETEEQP